MFKDFSREANWFFLLWLTLFSILVILIIFIVAPKPTLRYSLGANGGQLRIMKEVDWSFDEEIPLDRSIGYWDAIHMVDSLNKTIKR